MTEQPSRILPVQNHGTAGRQKSVIAITTPGEQMGTVK
jgi:hypothetical protein